MIGNFTDLEICFAPLLGMIQMIEGIVKDTEAVIECFLTTFGMYLEGFDVTEQSILHYRAANDFANRTSGHAVQPRHSVLGWNQAQEFVCRRAVFMRDGQYRSGSEKKGPSGSSPRGIAGWRYIPGVATEDSAVRIH
jgi:hypothetical protein